jgi:hypothetical protein
MKNAVLVVSKSEKTHTDSYPAKPVVNYLVTIYLLLLSYMLEDTTLQQFNCILFCSQSTSRELSPGTYRSGIVDEEMEKSGVLFNFHKDIEKGPSSAVDKG